MSPPKDQAVVLRVRLLMRQMLADSRNTLDQIAAILGMHPRTMQRRLASCETSFEAIRDEVRRDATLHYLAQTSIRLTDVSELVGYSEASVFTRSCYRWFSCSPRRLRARLSSRNACWRDVDVPPTQGKRVCRVSPSGSPMFAVPLFESFRADRAALFVLSGQDRAKLGSFPTFPGAWNG